MTRCTRSIFVLAMIAALGCSDSELPTASLPDPGRRPATDLVDAMHPAGNPHFFFLPPVAPTPRSSAQLDESLLPHLAVVICELDVLGKCGPTPVARFTQSSQPTGVRLQGDHYALNLQASHLLTAGRTYRAAVVVAGTQLGYADIIVARNAAELKTIDESKYVGIVQHQTLPIRFRIEHGAVVVIGAEGGDVVLAGGAVHMTVPAGAVSEPVGFTAVPTTVSALNVVPGTAYVFEPSGIAFTVPLTVSLRFSPAQLPEHIDARTVWLHKVVNGTLVGVADGQIDVQNGVISGKVTGFSTWTAAVSEVAAAIVEISGMLTQLITDPTVVDLAIRARMAVIALVQLINYPEYEVFTTPFYEQSGRDICFQYNSAASRAMTASVSTYQQVREYMQPVATWFAMAQAIGVECAGAPTLDQVFTPLAQNFTQFYQQKLGSTQTGEDFSSLTTEIVDLARLATDAMRLGVTPAAELVKTRAQHPLADAMREKAYAVCHVSGDQQLLAKLRQPARQGLTSYSEQAIVQDVQLCGSRVTAQLVKNDGNVKATVAMLNGDRPDAAPSIVAVRSLRSGSVAFNGGIRALSCAADGSTDKLLARINGTVLYQQDPVSGAYAPRQISLADMHSAANIDPTVAATYRLELVRTSDGCGGTLAPAGEYVIAAIDLIYPQIQVRIDPQTALVQANALQQFDAVVTGSTQGVTWQVSGGGTISSSGLFTAGSQPGIYTITATSVEDREISADATVTVQSNDARIRFVVRCSARADAMAWAGGDRVADFNNFAPAQCPTGLAENLATSISGQDVNGGFSGAAQSNAVVQILSVNGTLTSLSSSGNTFSTAGVSSFGCPGCTITVFANSQFFYQVELDIEGSDHLLHISGDAAALCGGGGASARVVMFQTAPVFALPLHMGAQCGSSSSTPPVNTTTLRLAAGGRYMLSFTASSGSGFNSAMNGQASASSTWDIRLQFEKARD